MASLRDVVLSVVLFAAVKSFPQVHQLFEALRLIESQPLDYVSRRRVGGSVDVALVYVLLAPKVAAALSLE